MATKVFTHSCKLFFVYLAMPSLFGFQVSEQVKRCNALFRKSHGYFRDLPPLFPDCVALNQPHLHPLFHQAFDIVVYPLSRGFVSAVNVGFLVNRAVFDCRTHARVIACL